MELKREEKKEKVDGKIKEKFETIKRLNLMGMKLEDIAKAVEMEINKVEEVVNIAKLK